MLNMVQGFATLERIGSYGMSNIFPSAEAIRNIQISDILPSDDDETALKDELAIIVSRILTTYVPAYADLDTVWSIPHQYSTQSTLKSETVPLGILNKDESSTAGMIEILENYKEYVPENENGDPLALLLYCNGLSCERVEVAQWARINGADRWARLDLFEPAIQEWHRRLMFLRNQHITWSHWIKYSYDNASIMVGKNSSVLTRICSENLAGKFEQQYHPVSNECKEERK